MPNIVLVGYAENAKDMRSRILAKIRTVGEIDMDSPLINTTVTIMPAEVKDIAGSDKSYVIIESCNGEDFEKMMGFLRALKIPLRVKKRKLDSETEIRP